MQHEEVAPLLQVLLDVVAKLPNCMPNSWLIKSMLLRSTAEQTHARDALKSALKLTRRSTYKKKRLGILGRTSWTIYIDVDKPEVIDWINVTIISPESGKGKETTYDQPFSEFPIALDEIPAKDSGDYCLSLSIRLQPEFVWATQVDGPKELELNSLGEVVAEELDEIIADLPKEYYAEDVVKWTLKHQDDDSPVWLKYVPALRPS